MKNTFLSLFLLLSISLIGQDWKLSKDKNGIKVYTRIKAGSKLKEFKAETNIKGPVESLVKELGNVDNHKNWMKDVDLSNKLKETTDGFISFYKLNMPWPTTDRDMVLRVKEVVLPNGAGLDISSATAEKSEEEGTIRISEIGGKWRFIDDGNGGSNITYAFFADPAGSLPTWAINMFIVDGPYESLLNLRELLEQ